MGIRFQNHLIGMWLGFLAIVLGGCSDGYELPPEIRPNPQAAYALRESLRSSDDSSAESAEAEDLPEPTGYATLSGTFTLDGEAPTNPALSITKDQEVCMPGGETVRDPVVVAGPNGGLANVLIYVDGLPEEWAHESMIGSTETVEFDQKNCLFLSRVFAMQTTQTLKILNSDPVGHNADMKPSKNLPYNPNIAGNGYATYPPQEGELNQENAPFGISCGAHPWMKAYMIFRENGYFAVTDDSGYFEIPNLPSGVPLKFVAWHEACKFIPDSAVEVDDSIAQDWSKRGAFTVKLEPDTRTELQVELSSDALSN